MTRIIEQYTAKEIMSSERLQHLAKEEMLQRVKVLYKVKEILSFPRDGYINISNVAEFYEVEESKVSSLLGIAEELEGELNLLVSKMDMLNVGFLLNESVVAQELRNQVVNIRDAV
ncbi:hypothetical protein [Virgibacillus siamensis]|uniref:hypothetical protein n=1 Tax=Virgibacillus siamensis TaxID=480071 RepID=UPI000987A23C|nr:hypothetical protein [Virgibacillus siamensis]